MASIYFRGKSPAGSWWLQFYHPESGELLRFSLGSGDGAYADLVRRRVEVELALLDKAIRSVELPPEIATAAGIKPPAPIVVPAPLPETPASPSPAREPLTVEAALAHYLAHIHAENDRHHVEGKISMLRQIFGSGLFPYKATNNKAKPLKGCFSGKTIGELTPEVVLQFLNAGSLSRKTMRHYRELLHHLFEVLLKSGKIEPSNYHTPNPMSSLPAFLDKGRARIVFLGAEDKKAQESALAGFPSLLAGFKLMTEAGLRRSEALWLRREDIAEDRSFLSIANRNDGETASTVKTSRSIRAVTVLPALKAFLEGYLPELKGRWLVPSPRGKRWNADNFSASLRAANEAASLAWSAGHYRHTYATDRAAEGWSLFDLANEMGTSVEMIQSHYAAYIRPSRLSRSAS